MDDWLQMQMVTFKRLVATHGAVYEAMGCDVGLPVGREPGPGPAGGGRAVRLRPARLLISELGLAPRQLILRRLVEFEINVVEDFDEGLTRTRAAFGEDFYPDAG